MPTLWRISNYTSPSGEGGLYYSGRWHSVGQRIVYLAESAAGALIESLVHLELDETRLPRSYSLLEIDAPGNVEVETINVLDVSDWKSRPAVTRGLGDEWLRARRTAMARVPSAIAPNTWNVLINPDHPDAVKIRVLQVVRAEYDPRLFPKLR
jgi:RES domain-containing protein